MTISALFPETIQRMIWDVKYGLLRYGHGTLAQTAELIADRARNGALLDLGCGAGSFYRCLRAAGFTGHYTGVDLSPSAIVRASHGSVNAQWHTGTIQGFQLTSRYAAICLIESIYYLDTIAAADLVCRCVAALEPGGACFIRIHDTEKHARHIRMLDDGWSISRRSENLLMISH